MKLKGGPTQDEILAISLMKLGLRRGDVFADIGCGTGKVALAASSLASRVHAVDLRKEAIDHARASIEAAGASNIVLHHSSAVDFLSDSEDLDCAFVGGSKDLEEVLGLLARKTKRSVVVNAVMLSTLNLAVETMQRLGIFQEVVQVQVSRSYPIAGGMMFKPIDPVFIVVGGFDQC